MTYAARDAQVSVALFFHLLGLHSAPYAALSGDAVFRQLSSHCEGLVDAPFRGEESAADGGRRRRGRREASESPGSGDQQVPDPRKNRRKPLGVGYSAR